MERKEEEEEVEILEKCKMSSAAEKKSLKQHLSIKASGWLTSGKRLTSLSLHVPLG